MKVFNGISCFFFLMLAQSAYSQVESVIMGGENDYAQIENDGTLEFKGEATVWEDYQIHPTNKLGQNNTPDWVVFQGGVYGLSFGDSQMDQVFFEMQLPHS